MDKLYTWALALILVGVVLMAFGIVTRVQRKMLEGDLERFDAVVTKLKPVSRRYKKLDPMHPTVFMIEDMENDPELERQYKSAPLVIGMGAAVLVIGVVLLILHIMK